MHMLHNNQPCVHLQHWGFFAVEVQTQTHGLRAPEDSVTCLSRRILHQILREHDTIPPATIYYSLSHPNFCAQVILLNGYFFQGFNRVRQRLPGTSSHDYEAIQNINEDWLFELKLTPPMKAEVRLRALRPHFVLH